MRDLKSTFIGFFVGFICGAICVYVYFLLAINKHITVAIYDKITPSPPEETVFHQPIVSSLLQDLDCAVNGEDIPFFRAEHSGNKVIAIVGMWKGNEVYHAVWAGYIVYAFEPNMFYINQVAKKIDNFNSSKRGQITPHRRYYIVKLDKNGNLIEPIPPPPRHLLYNGFCYFIPAGASDFHGQLPLMLSESASSFIDPELRNRTETVMVPITRIDSIITSNVHFMKVDTQGFEVSALKGASNLFDRGMIRSVMVEHEPLLLEPSPVRVSGHLRSPINGNGSKELIELLTIDLKLSCFWVRANAAKNTQYRLHPEDIPSFVTYVSDVANSRRHQQFSALGDFLCIRTHMPML